MRPPIHSVKHYRQIPRSQVATVALNTERLAIGVNVTAANLESEVKEGSLIKAVYVELWMLSTGNDGSDVVVLSKNADNSAGITFAESSTLFTYTEKKNILFTHQGLSSNDGVGNPIPVMRAWYKIPKSKQRFGLGDVLNLSIANFGVNALDYCGFAIYKEHS